MRGVAPHPNGDDVRRDLERSRELGKEMRRTADEIVRELRLAAVELRRTNASSNRA
jgi:hypothetical protein